MNDSKLIYGGWLPNSVIVIEFIFKKNCKYNVVRGILSTFEVIFS